MTKTAGHCHMICIGNLIGVCSQEYYLENKLQSRVQNKLVTLTIYVKHQYSYNIKKIITFLSTTFVSCLSSCVFVGVWSIVDVFVYGWLGLLGQYG